jgi:hypothetical protein
MNYPFYGVGCGVWEFISIHMSSLTGFLRFIASLLQTFIPYGNVFIREIRAIRLIRDSDLFYSLLAIPFFWLLDLESFHFHVKHYTIK